MIECPVALTVVWDLLKPVKWLKVSLCVFLTHCKLETKKKPNFLILVNLCIFCSYKQKE